MRRSLPYARRGCVANFLYTLTHAQLRFVDRSSATVFFTSIKMLACLLLVATCSWGEFIVMVARSIELCVSRSAVIAVGERCEFPANNPIQDLESGETVPTESMYHDLVYVYTDTFGNCNGCVRSINFCYRPGNAQSEELMTIEIRNNGNQMVASYTVTANAENDRNNCAERYSLSHTDCCVEQILTESFYIPNSGRRYALRISNPSSSLLRHQTATANGFIEHLNRQSMSGSVYKPLFYFTIDPSDGRFSSITDSL